MVLIFIHKTPYLLVPWLGVYMVGIISCYIAAIMYFLTVYYEDKMNSDPVVPAVTGQSNIQGVITSLKYFKCALLNIEPVALVIDILHNIEKKIMI